MNFLGISATSLLIHPCRTQPVWFNITLLVRIPPQGILATKFITHLARSVVAVDIQAERANGRGRQASPVCSRCPYVLTSARYCSLAFSSHLQLIRITCPPALLASEVNSKRRVRQMRVIDQLARIREHLLVTEVLVAYDPVHVLVKLECELRLGTLELIRE